MNINLSIFKPKTAFAYSLGEGPGIKIETGSTPATQLEGILSMVLGFLTIVAVIYFVIQVILAGYAFISGQGDEKKIESARKKLTDGILGLTIVVIALGVSAFLAKLLGISNVFDLNSFINSLNPGSGTNNNSNILQH
jgi:hypothetical protein